MLKQAKPKKKGIKITVTVTEKFAQALIDITELETARRGARISQGTVLCEAALKGNPELAELYKHGVLDVDGQGVRK